MTRDGRRPTLWAISDLHTGHTGNKPVTESLHPSSPDDWLIVAGDVAERTDEIRWALDLLRKRFAKVIWVPGNHELWTTNRDPMQIFGRARYDYLVNMCDEMGVVTPEHPFPVWTERGRPGDHRADVPALRLHVPARRARRPRPRAWPSPGSATWWAPTSSCCPPSRTPPAMRGVATGWRTPASGSRTSTG